MTINKNVNKSGSINDGAFQKYLDREPSHATELLTQLSAITCERDPAVLHAAFNKTVKGNRTEFDISLAVEWILSRPVNDNCELKEPVSNKNMGNNWPVAIVNRESGFASENMKTPNNSKNSASKKDNGLNDQEIIDLTKNESLNDNKSKEDDDLQKAINLSLQDNGASDGTPGVSKEDLEISKALEASMVNNNDQWMSQAWPDPVNPHDRKRNELWPVGLKNVGQTCWFSAVIQSLFHIHSFRSLVLEYMPDSSAISELKIEMNKTQDPAKPVDLPVDQQNKRIQEFMIELRKLFGHLVASQRKYVDPTGIIKTLRLAFKEKADRKATKEQMDTGSATILTKSEENAAPSVGLVDPPENGQQDVSEFTHIILEWLEEAFKAHASSNNNKMEVIGDTKNTMKDLFSGQVLNESCNKGTSSCRSEAFGQWPLHVQQCMDLHEALEKSVAREYLGEDSSQEKWFDKLPPIMIFELSRFHFNNETKQGEKIHSRLEFSEKLYMDRYMNSNKSVIRMKRDEMRLLKEKRAHLMARLDQYTNYIGSTKNEISVPTNDTNNFKEAQSNKEINHLPLPTILQRAIDFIYAREDVEIPMDTGDECEETIKHDSVSSQIPYPKVISEEESRVVKDCLVRWKKEVDSEISSLEVSINDINLKIESLYDEKELKCLEYQLHAVMVHEGSINSGHYWTYVHDRNRQTWLKFNDNTVTEVLWDELLKESIGGYSKTSAYSLIYIDSSKSGMLFKTEETGSNAMKESNMGLSEMDILVNSLPQDLCDIVQRSNNEFIEECVKWDTAQEVRKAEEEAKQKEAMEQDRKRLKKAKEEAELQKEFQGKIDSSDPNNNKADEDNVRGDSRVLRNSKEFSSYIS